MTVNNRLNAEELEAIRKRAEKLSKGNILRDTRVLALNNKVVFEDVPKLLAEIERLKTVANDILEEYDSSERRVIDEVSTNRKFALHMHEAYLRSCKNEINGVDDNDEN
jgi:hypothetical protein